MSSEELPGLSTMPTDLYITNQKQFLNEVPDLITKLRMRNPANAWRLNLSTSSLALLDQYIAAEVDPIILKGLDVAEVIDRNFLREVTAYVGEVIVQNKNGWWQVDVKGSSSGPLVVFPIKAKKRQYKTIDLYEHILTAFVEGESLVKWYEMETE